MVEDRIFGSFEWDLKKEDENIYRHGVSFVEASWAFFDPQRVLAIDERHSQEEPRYFCIGRVGSEIATVRFTVRGDLIRIIGAGYWRKGRKLYEEKNES